MMASKTEKVESDDNDDHGILCHITAEANHSALLPGMRRYRSIIALNSEVRR